MIKIFINEQHKILPEQLNILNETFKEEGYEFWYVPADGYTLEQIKDISNQKFDGVVFISPIPVLIGMLAAKATETNNKVFVFHNDKRDKKELPDGRIIQVVSLTGWELVRVA